jgi:hypothetical protein
MHMRIWNAILLAAVVMLPAVAVALAADSRPYARGGRTIEFAKDVQKYNSTGERFRITGHGQSACTMFLAARGVCVEPSARLLFHAGDNETATRRMLNSYNGKLRSYLITNKIMATPTFTTIPGRVIIKRFGYKAC